MFFVGDVVNVTHGAFSQVSFVMNGARAVFAHDVNPYDFLIPLNVATQSLRSSLVALTAFLATKREQSLFDAVPLRHTASDSLERQYSQRLFVEQDNSLVIQE